MFKKVVCGCVHCIQEPMYFMAESMFFHFFPSDMAKIAPIKINMYAFISFVYFSSIILYCLTLNLLQILILKVYRMYNIFGSGAAHGIYTQFI